VSRTASVLVGASVLAAVTVLAGPPARTAPAADVAPSQQPASPWSAPAVLSDCPATASPQVVFPSDRPSHATGRGAVVWSAAPTCLGGSGARVAAIVADDVPGAGVLPRTATGQPIAPRGPLLASGAPHGQIVIAGAWPGEPARALLIQGGAGGPFSALAPPGGASAPIALAHAYLGDVALASPPGGGGGGRGGADRSSGLRVHVERFFSHRFARNVSASANGHGSLQALTLAMDFRSDALAVWAQDGAIYARDLPGSGTHHPIQRLGPAGSRPRIAAVLSDDNRAIVAWTEQRATQTTVYVDRSAIGVRFGAANALERFTDPDGVASPAASPSLVRLSSESVMLAWAGVAGSHWVVRAAPVDLQGVRAVSTIAAPDTDALLADLAPGPAGDALLLWTEPSPTAAGPPDVQRQAIFAARGIDSFPGRAIFGPPEPVAPPGPVSDATVAVDPDSDRAVSVWRGEGAAIEYSIRGDATDP
jgi:hypothetical protein